jgi:hypothetical protein
VDGRRPSPPDYERGEGKRERRKEKRRKENGISGGMRYAVTARVLVRYMTTGRESAESK